MRIPSGKTDQLVYFVAVDSVDLKTRKTALSSFTVYRSRNGGVATAYTTPTVAELSAANAPGVYTLVVDEDTTIAAGSDSEEYCVHITQAAMAPVTRTVELYRRDTTSGQTLAVDASGRALADLDTIKTNPVVNGGTVTFPTTATLASTTNITAGTITTLTNLPTIPANWITAAGIATGAIDADALATDAVVEIRSLASGTSDSGTTTTMVDAVRTEADTDYWRGSIIVFTSGTIAGQARHITGFTPGTDTLTFAPAVTQAVSTQTYEIWPSADYLRATSQANTLDVSATGEAGIDWANIGSPTTAQNLSSTNLDVDQIVASVTGAVGSVTGAVGSVTGAVGSVTAAVTVGTINANVITATSIAADAITDAKVAADVTIASVTGAVGSVAGNVAGNVTGSVGSIAAAGIAAASFSAAALNAIADADLDRNMAAGTDSGTDSTAVRTPRQALRVLRNKTGIALGVATITKEDDVTASWTAAITTAAGNPITQVDPT